MRPNTTTPPTWQVVAGAKVLAELRPTADFEWRVDVPAADILSTNGLIAITTDRVCLPGQAEGTADTRRLGVRLFEIRVNPVNP